MSSTINDDDHHSVFNRACSENADILSIRSLVLLAQEQDIAVEHSELYKLVDALKTTYVKALKCLKEFLLKQGDEDDAEVERDEDDDPVEPSKGLAQRIDRQADGSDFPQKS